MAAAVPRRELIGTWNQCRGMVRKVKLEKPEILDLLQVASTEPAGDLRWSGGGASGREREFRNDSQAMGEQV